MEATASRRAVDRSSFRKESLPHAPSLERDRPVVPRQFGCHGRRGSALIRMRGAIAEQRRAPTVVARNMGAFMTRLILVIATAFVFSNTAFAQSSGTPQDQAACRASVKRYCAQAIQGGDMMVLSCLQQNRPRISKACQRVLLKYGQ